MADGLAPTGGMRVAVRLAPAIVSRLKRGADARSHVPAHGWCRIAACADGTVTATVHNGYYAESVGIPGNVALPGAAILSISELTGAVKAAGKGGTIALGADGAAVTVRTGGAAGIEFAAQPCAVEDWAPRPTVEGGAVYKLSRTDLHAAFSAVQHAMSCDDTRPHLSAAMLDQDGVECSVIAMDGHRLAVATIASFAPPFQCLVPAPAVHAAIAMLAAHPSETMVDVIVGQGLDRELRIGGDSIRFSSPDASFPTWRQVIPSATETLITFKREHAQAALASLKAFTPRRNNATAMKFTAEGRVAHFSTKTDESIVVGANPFPITVDHDATIGVNAKYLTDALGVCSAPVVRLRFSGEVDPMLLLDVAPWGTLTVVIMPMRI